MPANPQNNSPPDRELVDRILSGDQQAWSQFVEKYTDWVFYKANQWTQRESRRSREPRRTLVNLEIEKEYQYSEAALDAYLWIFQQLRNKLSAYSGRPAQAGRNEASLSTFIWSILNSKFLFIDFLRWRPDSMPRALRQCSEIEQKVYFMLRDQIPVEEIAASLALSIAEVLDTKDAILARLAATGHSEAPFGVTEIELSEELRNILKLPENLSEDQRMLFNKIIERYTRSLSQLPPQEVQLLEMFYNDELSAEEILAAYKTIDMSLPSTKSMANATRTDVYKAMDKVKTRLLKLLQKECEDLREAVIDQNSVKVLLDQLGVMRI